MWHFQQRKDSYLHATSLNLTGPQATSDTTKNRQLTTEGFVNSGMKPFFSKTWDMKWHWLIYKEVLEKLRLYCDRGTNNDADYFTKKYPPIHYRQI